jgi:cytochrome c oxidase cbb3-type subunit 3
VPVEYIGTIVDKGGQAVGRSPQMPPWGEQLNAKELSSVVKFVMTLREKE